VNARTETLRALIELTKPIPELKQELSAFSFDCDEELVTLRRIHLVAVLMRYIRDELGQKEVQDWANLVECREGIGFEGGRQGPARECLHALSNPLLTEPLTKRRAEQLINDL
jgi:hypothetical protein